MIATLALLGLGIACVYNVEGGGAMGLRMISEDLHPSSNFTLISFVAYTLNAVESSLSSSSF